jgi:DNA-3-methyladenine glycosylase II
MSESRRKEQEVQRQPTKIAPNSQNRKIHKRAMDSFELRAVSPFRLDLTAWALRRRPENQVDRWDGITYRRVVLLQSRPAEISVSQKGSRSKTSRIGGEISRLETSSISDSFETLANAFACQQFTLSAGLQLLDRLTKRGSVAFKTETGTVFGFPEPSDLLRISSRTFRTIGFSRQKTRAFRDLSRDILAQRIDFKTLTNYTNKDAIDFLLALRGVGRWTAEYVLLRGLGRLDVFPADDVGARNRLAKWLHRSGSMNYASVLRALDRWQPYAGLIYFNMLMESLSAAGKFQLNKVPARGEWRIAIRPAPSL